MHLPSFFALFRTKGIRGTLVTGRAKTVFDIDYNHLAVDGITLLMYDVDDTLGGYHDTLSDDVLRLLRTLTQQFSIAAISNCPPERMAYLDTILRDTGVFVSPIAHKPSSDGVLHTLRHFNRTPECAAMIGERTGMDLFGAYTAGVRQRILVDPYSSVFPATKAPLLYRWCRNAENIFLR